MRMLKRFGPFLDYLPYGSRLSHRPTYYYTSRL